MKDMFWGILAFSAIVVISLAGTAINVEFGGDSSTI